MGGTALYKIDECELRMPDIPLPRGTDKVAGTDAGDHRKHLLLVDDRPEDLSLLIELLKAEDFRITLAFDGHQAITRAIVGLPDLIVMDVTMPNLDGFGACRLLKADAATAHIPIIFLTSANHLTDRLEGLRHGGVDYVIKPFYAEEMVARIHIHLRGPGQMPHQADLSNVDAQSDTKEKWMVRAVVRYLQDNLVDTPSMEALAQQFGTYPKKLSAAFRSVLGKTIPEFLRAERLMEAERLLQHSSLSFTDIAAELGFSSAANFSTAFRQHAGVTPGVFRQQGRNVKDED